MLFNFLSDVTETTETTVSWNWQEFLGKIFNWLQTSGVKLLIGLVGLFILFAIVNGISKRVRNKIIKKKNDKTIANVVFRLIRYGGKGVLFLLFLGYVGIDTAGIGAIIASCSVAVGLALQGSLANIAGWVIIIIMRPFKLGDFIEAQGMSGTVEDIRLFYTYIATGDNKLVMIPNGILANGNITNYFVKENRRVEQTFSIAYEEDVAKAIEIIENTLKANALVLEDPAVFVRVSEYADSSINILARCWTKSENYWTVYFQMLSDVKKAFDENKIVVPFNQLEVNIINGSKE